MLPQPTFLMNQTVTIKPFLGTAPNGPKYDSVYSSVCRFESKQKRLVDDLGKTFYSAGIVFLPASQVNIERETILTIDGRGYKVVEKQIMRGFAISHIECVVI